MPRPKIYENAHARRRAQNQRRAIREGWAPKPKRAKPNAPVSPAVQLYRAECAARKERLEREHAEIMARVQKAVAEADARAHELRHRGRPKGKKNLLLNVGRRSPDVLLASVSDWHGER